jgi:hypothetical protein
MIIINQYKKCKKKIFGVTSKILFRDFRVVFGVNKEA